MDFSLREFRREDFETLWSIDHQCFPPGISYGRAELHAYMRRPGSFTLVAESAMPNGADSPGAAHQLTTVGFIVAETGRRRGLGHIITIDVLPSVRRVGLGSHLLASAESRLKSANCEGVLLEVAVNNGSAIAFYKRHKYDVLRTIPHYYADGVDALVLGKRLAER
ncbi:MAG TPA: N-acetyltransferase [Terriglobales bacterium]|nr:N-acetyltransferase [Terriglobales bacterium]